MSFRIGIVGLPNVGKSTLFKALTKKQVLIANYPFATIEPNVGVVPVPDERLEKLSQVSRSEKTTPTTIEFYDIAGLVKGAHQGEGLGNQFLAHIREVDAIVEVVRAFKDPDVIHVQGEANPKRDIEIISLELCMADLKTVEKKLDEIKAKVKSQDKEAIKFQDCLIKIRDGLNQGIWAKKIVSQEEEKIISPLHLLTMKPCLFVFNTDEHSPDIDFENLLPGEKCLAISAKLESELADLSEQEAKEMMQSLGLAQSGLDRLIMASYQLLGLITFFTSGPKESRAWTIKKGTKAPQAAGKIHSDFEKNFVRVEVIYWLDFVNAQGEAKAKELGLMHLEGKDYTIQDGDVCYFRVAV